MKKIGALLVVLFLLIGCVAQQEIVKATEGEVIETQQTREESINMLVGLLAEEGFDIDTINEKYGLISCKPYKIQTGQLMKKLGESGGDFVNTNPNLVHTINFSASISEKGTVKIKTTALTFRDENVFTMMRVPNESRRSEQIDVLRTNKLNQYLADKIKARLTTQ